MITKQISLIHILLAFAFNIKAQDVTGDWYGAIKVNGAQLHMVFHISKAENVYITTFDSPDQDAKGLGTDQTSFTGNAITIAANKFGIKYTGTYQPDSGVINGAFTQGALNLPLVLTRKQPQNNQGSIKRPQDPVDFPYQREDVTFTNLKGGNILTGTLTIPAGGNASKIVVLITGSGAQDRNEELQGMNHRPFLVLSDWLTRNGIAVLRYDDRGTGQSTGNFINSTTADFADDAEAAVQYIQSRPDLNKLNIGLIGHSEGGIVAPMVASRNKAVQFICLLAGPGIPMVEVAAQQQKDLLHMQGMTDEAMKVPLSVDRSVFKAIVDHPKMNTMALKAKLDTVLLRELSPFPPERFATESKQTMIDRITTQWLSPYYRYTLSIKPADYLTKVKCPVLALNGTLDIQIESVANLAGIKAALQKAGNTQHEEVALPGLNHLFQQAKTGSMNEYAQIAETISPVVLKNITAWINSLK